MRYTNWKLSLPFTLNSSYWRPDHLHKCHYLAGLPSILVFTYLHLGFKSKRRLFHHQPQAPVVGSAAFLGPWGRLMLPLVGPSARKNFSSSKILQEMVWNGEKIGWTTFFLHQDPLPPSLSHWLGASQKIFLAKQILLGMVWNCEKFGKIAFLTPWPHHPFVRGCKGSMIKVQSHGPV